MPFKLHVFLLTLASASACTPQFNALEGGASPSPSPSASSDPTTTTTVATSATTTSTAVAAATTTTVAATTTTVLSSDSFVLGQPDMATNRKYKNGMNTPQLIHTDGTKLYLADQANHRVLIWNSIPTANSTLPDRILGQISLSLGGVNLARAGNAANVANGLNNPYGVWSNGTKVVVTDTSSSRILIWNSFPTADGQNADLVLSAADMTSNGGGTSASRVISPRGIYSDGTKLIVADLGNHRVLIWNTFPTANDQAANVVLGQANMTSGTANAGTTVNSNTLSSPYGVYSDGTKLFVTDAANHRVLIWNTIPTVNQTAADVVLGQADMTSGSPNRGGARTAATISTPRGISVSGSKLFVTDNANNRVLIWDTIPTVNGANASWVVGQVDMTSGTSSITSSTLFGPIGAAATGTKLIVSDYNRALVWNSIPTSNGVAADVVLGQPNMTSGYPNNDNLGTNGDGIAANTLPMPRHIFSDGSRTFVTEASSTQRVLIWNSATPTNGVAADVVVGQPDMTTSGNATTAAGVQDPEGVASDGTRLFVADTSNNRITIWNSIPSTNGVAADLVLGQADMTSSATGTSATTLNYPRAVQAVGGKLFAADYSNHRVLIWNSIPTSNQAAASVVVGQANMTSNVDGSGSPTASTLSNPSSVYSDGTRLIVADQSCVRVLIWNSIPTSPMALRPTWF